MGGYGSGRTATKQLTNRYLSLDIRSLRREGLLKEGSTFLQQWYKNKKIHSQALIVIKGNFLSISHHYNCLENRNTCQLTLNIVETKCILRGMRPWFSCPRCCFRSEILYALSEHFACRRCHNLTYRSQRRTRKDRNIAKAHEIRKVLGWSKGLNNPEGGKPKGMSEKKFQRMCCDYRESRNKAFSHIALELGVIDQYFDKCMQWLPDHVTDKLQ